MCEFCGCDEPAFRSVAVLLPAIDEPEQGTVDVYATDEWEEEE